MTDTGYQGVSDAIDVLVARAMDLKAENARLRETVRQRTKLLDDQIGTPCEQIRHEQEVEQLRAALEKCAAPFDTGPTTMQIAPILISTEFQRRMNIAAMALTTQQPPSEGK